MNIINNMNILNIKCCVFLYTLQNVPCMVIIYVFYFFFQLSDPYLRALFTFLTSDAHEEILVCYQNYFFTVLCVMFLKNYGRKINTILLLAVVFFCIDLAEFRYFFAFFGRKCLIYSVSCYLNLNVLQECKLEIEDQVAFACKYLPDGKVKFHT